MTREEAIDMIKNDMRLHHNYMSGEYRKALRMAISALQQPEIIHCRDCKHYCLPPNSTPQEQRYVCDLDWYRWNPDSFCSFAERREE